MPPKTTTAAGLEAPTGPTPGQLTLVDATPHVGRQGGYLAKNCPEQNAKDNMPLTYPPELKDEYSEFTLSIMNAGNDFEDRIGRLLAEMAVDPAKVAIIAEERDSDGNRTVAGKQAKEAATLAAVLDPTITVIFNARISSHFEALLCEHRGQPVRDLDPDRVSEPDMLVKIWVDGQPLLAPVDIKDHSVLSGSSTNPKTFAISTLAEPDWVQWDAEYELYGQLRKGDWMQLAHYRRHLENLNLVDRAAPMWGAVIGREELLVWSRLDVKTWQVTVGNGHRVKKSALDAYDSAFAEQLAVVANARARDRDPSIPSLVRPEWRGAQCAGCPWATVCREELQSFGEGGHITLLPGITSTGGGSAESAQALYKAGIEDVASLARHSPYDDIAGIRNTAKVVFQARANLAGKVFRAPDVEHVTMPRASIEIDFDLENSGGGWTTITDPDTGATREVRTDPLLYMFSIRATGRRKVSPGKYRERLEEITFDTYGNTEAGELAVYLDTWNYFQKMLAKARRGHHSIRFYHYTKHEWTWLRNLADKYAGTPGVPTRAQVEDFLTSGLVVDMYEILSRQLVWPTMSHSIKALAKHIRYTWNVDGQVGGDQSIAWHRTACTSEDEAARQAAIAKLRAYGQSDVEAQTRLREWVCELGQDRPGSVLPSVTTLKAPRQTRRRVSA